MGIFAIALLAVTGVIVAANALHRSGARQAPLTIQVFAKQYSWSFGYPAYGDASSNGIAHVPLGRPLRFEVYSEDVEHSFWVPEWGIDKTAAPGSTATFTVTPGEPGSFQAICAQLCGIEHANMRAELVVEPRARFADWIAGIRQSIPRSLAATARRSTELEAIRRDTNAEEHATTAHSHCRFKAPSGKVFVPLEADSSPCAEARRVYTTFDRQTAPTKIIHFGDSLRVDGWTCEPYGQGAYPLLVTCLKGKLHFDVASTTPIIHTFQEQLRPRSAGPTRFQTPTGDVACEMSRYDIRCEIFGSSWTPPRRPKSCPGRWGRSIVLPGATVAHFSCDTEAIVLPDGESGLPILAVGSRTRVQQYVCEMRATGLSCRSRKHGFLLSFHSFKIS